MTIGSAETCDVILNTDGVSRKHLLIQVEDDRYYVVDQGSTNGSYMNEERLIPGRRIEFTSFFPVRLGANVLITLLSDEEDLREAPIQIPVPQSAKETAEDSSTRVLSLKDLQSVSTKTLIKNRDKIVLEKKKLSTKKAPSKVAASEGTSHLPKLIAAVLLGGAVYVNIFMPRNEPQVQVQKVPDVKSILKTPTPSPTPEEVFVIPATDWPKPESIEKLLGDIKCASDKEVYLCSVFPEATGFLGAVQVGTSVIVLLPAEPFVKKAEEYLASFPPNSLGTGTAEGKEHFIKEMAGYFLVSNVALRDIDVSKLQDTKMYLSLFKEVEGVQKIYLTVGVLPKSLARLKAIASENRVTEDLRRIGLSALNNPKVYYVEF